MDFNRKNTVLITASRGLVPYLSREVEQLGYEVASTHATGLEITASLNDTMRLNLRLRTAFNVLYLLKTFECDGPDELYRNIFSIAWEEIAGPDEYVSVVSRIEHSSINNTMFANQKAKDAIVDKIHQEKGARPDSGPERTNIVIHLYWKNDRAWVYLNTSGQKLADRSYRKIPCAAPLQETLAAGILFASGYDGNTPLVVPMCGSGTLAIEAALIALGRAPGLLRSNFGIIHVKGFDKNFWQEIRRETLKSAYKNLSAPIIATDIDRKAIEAAKKNARTAGCDHLIEFKVCDFTDTPLPENPGILIFNPPYGERLGELNWLEKLYKAIGDFLKTKCTGYTGYIFTGNRELSKAVGLRTSRKVPFYNGDIECRLLQYKMYSGSVKKKYRSGPEDLT
ncbi:MAG: methyltransferase [Candidatus Omnitrophica bacterium]|nr:methyltransferase [Candidatus Omnitrophota bacterium]